MFRRFNEGEEYTRIELVELWMECDVMTLGERGLSVHACELYSAYVLRQTAGSSLGG